MHEVKNQCVPACVRAPGIALRIMVFGRERLRPDGSVGVVRSGLPCRSRYVFRPSVLSAARSSFSCSASLARWSILAVRMCVEGAR